MPKIPPSRPPCRVGGEGGGVGGFSRAESPSPRPIDSLFSPVDSSTPITLTPTYSPIWTPAGPPRRPIRNQRKKNLIHTIDMSSLPQNVPPEARIQVRVIFITLESLFFPPSLSKATAGGWGRQNKAISGCSQRVDGSQTY